MLIMDLNQVFILKLFEQHTICTKCISQFEQKLETNDIDFLLTVHVELTKLLHMLEILKDNRLINTNVTDVLNTSDLPNYIV